MTSLTFPSRITRPVTIACLWMVIVLGLTTAHGDATVTTSPPGIVSTVLVGGLEQAVAFTFAPDRRVWFVEKGNADVRIYDPATGRIDDFFHVRGVVAEAEQGLVGIALHPRFPERPYVYLYATRLVHGVPWDQLLRVIDDGGRGTRQRVLWQARASTGHQHSGGRLIFGPDDALYMTVGDALDADVAQDLNSDRGKILRLREDGEPARGTPSLVPTCTRTGSGTPSGSRSIRGRNSCGRRRTGPRATTRSTGSSRAPTTDGARAATAGRRTHLRARTSTGPTPSRPSSRSRRRSRRRARRSATAAGSAGQRVGVVLRWVQRPIDPPREARPGARSRHE